VPRRPLPDDPQATFHVVNRAAHGQLLFATFGEHLLFLRLLERTLRLVPIDLYAFVLMPNHFHLLIRVPDNRGLSAFMHLLTMTHARILRQARGTVGRGAIYQGRFRARCVDTELYFARAVRYIARNPVRAGFVLRAEDWPWSSESPVAWIQGLNLARWPVARHSDWLDFVNDAEPAEDVEFFRAGIRDNEVRGRLKAAASSAISAPSIVAVSDND